MKAWLLSSAALAAVLTLTTVHPLAAQEGRTMVKLETSMGDIMLELYPDKAPKTVANFVSYVREGFYDGTLFHRVIGNFMIQGGGLDKNMAGKKTREPIANEADNGLRNALYTVAMARTGEPHSATAQFFINVKENRFLDHSGKTQQGWGYTVFGQVAAGREVVDRIKAVKTGARGGHENVPVEPVLILKATLLEK